MPIHLRSITQIEIQTMTTKQLIREYVDDHYNNFGFYPYDVEVDGMIFSYGNYWSILEDRRFD